MMPRTARSALANQVRLVLHTAAYWLLLMVRDVISRPHRLATAEFMRLAWRFTKIAARVCVAFAAECPAAALFRGIATSASSPQHHNSRGSPPPASDPPPNATHKPD